ncbi:MFS transporter [Nonomuraea antimicrobica]|uniref:MFS transporter n=1 Tax=Nonomuraea antimicrobica TaxID=561173 RepID=UPI0031EDED1A
MLRNPGFRLFFAADTASQIGSNVALVALPLVAVMALGASPFETGLVVVAERAAYLLVSLPAGVWVDRLRRRPIMMVADLARAVLLASIPLAWWVGALTMAQLYVVALVTGLATVFFDIAYQSYLPSLVGRDLLVDGNSKLEVVRSGAEVSGPMLGGWLVQFITAPLTVLATAAGYLLSAVFLGRIRVPESVPGPTARRGLFEEIGEGLRFVATHPILRMIVLCMGIANFSASMLLSVQAIFMVREVGVSPGLYGTLMAAGALGGLAAVVLVRPLTRRIGSARLIWVALLVAAPGSLLIPLTEPGWRVWLFAVGLFVDVLGVVMYSISQVSFRQATTPADLLGRMNATIRVVAFGALPLGALAGGLIGEVFGVRTAVWAGAVGSALCVIPLLCSPLVRMRDLPGGDNGGGPDDTGPALAPAWAEDWSGRAPAISSTPTAPSKTAGGNDPAGRTVNTPQEER